MMAKESYRDYFAECIKYIKLKPIVLEEHLNYSNFMKFLNNQADWCISAEKLEQLKQAVSERCSRFS